jgi:hypothetical protein
LPMSPGRWPREETMEILIGGCAGLDVHKDSVEACLRKVEQGGKLSQQIRHWGTTTRELVAMAEWFRAEGVTPIALESTGVYWKPIFNVLESEFQVLLVNARTIQHVPGRKTDVQDCQWIAQRLPYGFAEGKLHSPALATRTARPDPTTGAGDRRTQPNHQSQAEGSGGCEPQARFGRQ